MKSLLILVLICLAAWLTVPNQKSFDKYLVKKGRKQNECEGGMRNYSYKLFTINYVDYCEAGTTTKKTGTDKYLGLFGTFFKL